jgi:hypothetical membrane protein
MKNRHLVRMFLIAGILASALNMVIIVALDLTTPGYDFMTQYVSEFGITPGIASIVSAWWVIHGIILILFSVNLNSAMDKSGRFSFIGPLCICLYGLMDSIGSAAFPMDAAGTAEMTFSGMMHYLVSFIGITAVIFSPLALISRMKKDPAWNRFVRPAWITQIFFWAIYIICVLAFADIYFSWCVGLLQRIFIYAADIWIIALGRNACRDS